MSIPPFADNRQRRANEGKSMAPIWYWPMIALILLAGIAAGAVAGLS